MGIDAVVLAALPAESGAVCSHPGDLKERTSPEGTVYTVGTFGDLDIAVAEVGVGNDRAAVETTRALSFFSPRLVALVGVAGVLGMPRSAILSSQPESMGTTAGSRVSAFKLAPTLARRPG